LLLTFIAACSDVPSGLRQPVPPVQNNRVADDADLTESIRMRATRAMLHGDRLEAVAGPDQLLQVRKGVALVELAGLVPDVFEPAYNRLSMVIALADPSIRFDAADGPHWVADRSGHLLPARIDPEFVQPLTGEGALAALGLTGVDRVRVDPVDGVCFRVVDPLARVVLRLPEQVTGDFLMVRTLVTVNQPSTERVQVQQAAGGKFNPANDDAKQWLPGAGGQLDTVSQSRISAISVDSMTVGAGVCLRSITVGQVEVAAG
jgi:hypothetical protein